MTGLLFMGLLSAQAYAAEPTSSLDDMFSAKQKIKTADAYMQKNKPGNALVQLLEAKGIIYSPTFASEIDPRIQAAKSAFMEGRDSYKINLRVQDNTQSGRGEYLQSQLVTKSYADGIQMVEDGAYYTFIVDLQGLHVEQKETSLSHIVLMPVGQTRVPNGAYTALQQRINVDCQQYLAAQEQARGSGVQTVVGVATAVDSANSNNLWGVALGAANVLDASARSNSASQKNTACQREMDSLAETPMFTAETQTTPTRYTETTIRKTADMGVRFYLTAEKGTPVFTSNLYEVTFYKEDLARDEIVPLKIRGDPAESISDETVIRGAFSATVDTLDTITSNGSLLWDAILLKRAQNSTGENAMELYTQLFFQGHSTLLKLAGENYILAHSALSGTDLAIFW